MTTLHFPWRSRSAQDTPWSSTDPIREELFGLERLEQHARSLAAAQGVTRRPPRVPSLQARLEDNAARLLEAYRASVTELDSGRGVPPSAEWLLDNFHLVEEQVREIRDNLPPGFYRQLPKLVSGPFGGYPRIFGIGWAYIAHTDSRFDPDVLLRFILAYQGVVPLSIGELWALAITLRIVLVENLRRIAEEIVADLGERAEAEALANRFDVAGDRSALDREFARARPSGTMSPGFVATLARRLRDRDPSATPAYAWLEDRLAKQAMTIDAVVQLAHQRQASSNVTVRNVITSMRAIGDIAWPDLFESMSLVDARLREGTELYGQMDFPTRNLYRSAIEQLSRHSRYSELEVTERALAAVRTAAASSVGDELDRLRTSDPGYHLIGDGRGAIERELDFDPPIRLRLGRRNIRRGLTGYVGWTLILSVALIELELIMLDPEAMGPLWLAAFALVTLLPMTETATAIVNRLVAFSVGARTLPALDLAKGVPASLRTLVVIPCLLTDATEIADLAERLEVHYLSGSAIGELYFALLTDWTDGPAESMPGDDALLAVAHAEIERLNRQHAAGPAGPRFALLHRSRSWSETERCWMGWERKRGKLTELNRLLRGNSDTRFIGDTSTPANVRYVITLDADTRMPRDTAARLVGKMAHPLNRPRFDTVHRRVIDGYGILQPRVTPSLPLGGHSSIYQRALSGPSGLDPYAGAVSNIYQDLFGEGSFTGKGIYDVDAFEFALEDRVPDGALLSHDLFEGSFARAGLASDVKVVEDFPTRYDVDAKRQHRWTRGDWQLLPWIVGRRGGVPTLGRWKMIDNLRRSLIMPTTLLAFGLCWMLPTPSAWIGIDLLVATLALPMLLSPFTQSRPSRVALSGHLRRLGREFQVALLQILLMLALMPDRARVSLDAVIRTLARLATRRRLMEWTSMAQSAGTRRPGLAGSYRSMRGGLACAAAVVAIALIVAPGAWALAAPFAALWALSPVIAWWISRPLPAMYEEPLSIDESHRLRLIARRTWRYFETFVTEREHFLPPDNFQEDPRPVVARRTSPTNIGLYLLSTIAARDFGWAGGLVTLERLEATFATLRRLIRYKGHFYNWYATEDLRPLDPPYVSSVDSGNLAGHLITLAVACETWTPQSVRPARDGLIDALDVAHDILDSAVLRHEPTATELRRLGRDVETLLRSTAPLASLEPALRDLVDRAQLVAIAREAPPSREVPVDDDGALALAEVAAWFELVRQGAQDHARDETLDAAARDALTPRRLAIAREARDIALGMDFAYLLDPTRKLLSIGYSLADNRLDGSCYDLLASEARLASLFAIAKGDAPSEHWLRLGRSATPVHRSAALISWSGSMFEYLMPSLVMRAPAGSLLENTNRLVVQHQRDYAAARNIPWGISESAYNARDLEFTYQYSNFGVPDLGLKRGLGGDTVIAPYATGLASMIDARAALENFAAITAIGGLGRYGFHDALDFTRSRLPEGKSVVVVRNYMAHHQGMTILAITNALLDGIMRTRFHRDPMIAASELLLQERVPRDVPELPERVAEARPHEVAGSADLPSLRRVAPQSSAAPVTHLLSNGRYAVMLTAAGAGYSRWGDIAVTRWREDATRDAEGSWIYFRDIDTPQTWSAALQPYGADDAEIETIFGEDHATFHRRDGRLTTTTEVVVSGEDDAEVRRVTLTNRSRRAREIDITSYCELVLTTVATDNAHPAFAKMFVQTERLPASGVLVATRRKRTPDEPEVWAAHFAIVEGEQTARAQYDTDRSRFIGRSRNAADPLAMTDGRALGNTVGTVLDPVFALRHRVKVPPGGRVRVSYWTVMASSRDALLDQIDRHDDRSAFDRAKTYAWTHAQVQLRHLGIHADEAADFQRLAAAVVYNDPAWRAAPESIVRGMGPQSGLWGLSISGDLPIVLLRIDDPDDIAQVRQLLRAHEYWRTKRLAVDVVILNERASSYVQDLQVAIEAAVRSAQSNPGAAGGVGGRAYALRADVIAPEMRALLEASARVILAARRGPVAQQLTIVSSAAAAAAAAANAATPAIAPGRREAPAPVVSTIDPSISEGLEFFNGYGGFANDGREYVTLLQADRATPAPWVNVVANASFGFQASADGSGFTWAENSRDNQLTNWSNDAVCDPAGEAFYIRDDETGELVTPTAQPIRDGGRYVARHGFGYVRFEHAALGLSLELVQTVPLDGPVKRSRLRIRNLSDRPRKLTVTYYCEWVLGTSRGARSPFIASARDGATGVMLVRNAWGTTFPNRVGFVDLAGRQQAWTADRAEFLGRHGSLAAPAALRAERLSGRLGAGFDPCTAMQLTVELAPGAQQDVTALLGQAVSERDALDTVRRFRATAFDDTLAEVDAYWRRVQGSVQVKSPDRAMDILLNGWLLYQTLACRTWARSAFYQASGAYGFRDQLQDGMALTFALPQQTRQHLVRSAGRQFPEGDVQHWWLPHSGQGVRTLISDDRVWLAYAAATYIGVTGDRAVLDESIPFIEGAALQPGQHDAFYQPSTSNQNASLWEHCARGLDQCLQLVGAHGLPLMGTGDWNDGMNRVGEQGRGESVWLAWLAIRTIDLFIPLSGDRDPERIGRWRAFAESARASIERDAWDGDWYRRATFDDGTWMGSRDSEECRIDSIAQSWAVLSGAGDPERSRIAMNSVEQHLVVRDPGLALLFEPPFDTTHHDPGYIKGYPPGLRENGGQYSHAAMWVVMAFARMGDVDRAVDTFDLLNPIRHSATRRAANVYKVEPYVVAADVYGVAPLVGRGGWTWYTGSAGWMYRAGVDGILGLTREGDSLVLDPRLAKSWPGYSIQVALGESRCSISITRADDASVDAAMLDGTSLAWEDGKIRVPLDDRSHVLVVTLASAHAAP